MGKMAWHRAMALLALVFLCACASKQAPRPAAVMSGPDEFATVPNKPLVAPEDFSALPAPSPQGRNRADATPKSDAIVALGGRAPAAGGVDGGIVNYASRYGVDANIRGELAAADEKRAKRGGFLGLGRNSYERNYKRFALDPYDEWRRLRALGVKVPAAPPEK